MSRFFVNPEDIGNNLITIHNTDDIHHMMKVLRLKEGDEVDISDGVEWEYHARIESLSREEVQLQILDKQAFAAEPAVKVTLFQGIPKQGKMETIIQKCVELGVHRIVPVFMDRTVVVDRGNFSKKVNRWNKVSAEAVKQCRRGIIPEVALPVKTEATIKDALQKTNAANVAVIIGPEGGFSDEEALAIIGAGGVSVSLGKTILRTETAGMAAIAMIMYELEL